MLNQRVFCIVSLAVLLSACGQNSKSNHTHDTQSTAHKTVPGVWPPVLEGAQNEQPVKAVRALDGAKASIINAMRASVLNNPEVKRSLGVNYREFDASLSDAKSDNAADFLFFNYDTNVTVEASFSNDGTVKIENTIAAVFQPAEHADEVLRAIDLARNSLTNDGYNLGNLIGTAMLAFPPIANIENNAETFYAERVLYVTFGPSEGELPEYSALVNLSSASVFNAKLIN